MNSVVRVRTLGRAFSEVRAFVVRGAAAVRGHETTAVENIFPLLLLFCAVRLFPVLRSSKPYVNPKPYTL